MKLKKTINHCKHLFAILACAFPLVVNAQMDGMAHDTMNTTNSNQMGGMGSDNMNGTNTTQMGNMAPAMNTAPMDNMASGMMSEANPPSVGSSAPDFTLNTLDDQSVRLDDLTAKGNRIRQVCASLHHDDQIAAADDVETKLIGLHTEATIANLRLRIP